MRVYILVHEHRHGTDVWPFVADSMDDLPEGGAFIESRGSTFEPDREEYAEWHGPYELDTLEGGQA